MINSSPELRLANLRVSAMAGQASLKTFTTTVHSKDLEHA
jgi:hypothetical protein